MRPSGALTRSTYAADCGDALRGCALQQLQAPPELNETFSSPPHFMQRRTQRFICELFSIMNSKRHRHPRKTALSTGAAHVGTDQVISEPFLRP